jgi:sigma-E factor negative regulatory protein RseA
MNPSDKSLQSNISALVDGALSSPQEREQALNALLNDEQHVQAWHAYHVVGDVLRSAELAPKGDDMAFLRRFEQRLAQEPSLPTATIQAPTHSINTQKPAANRSVWAWRAVAGIAMVALVGVLANGLREGGAPQMVAVQQPAQEVMLRDPQLDELMAAHQQLGGHSALQLPAGFLRNATYEGPARK